LKYGNLHKMQCCLGNMGALDRRVLAHCFYQFSDKNNKGGIEKKSIKSEIKLPITCIHLILAICNHVTTFPQQLLLEVANNSSSSSSSSSRSSITTICTLLYKCTYPVNGANGICIHIHRPHLV